MGFAIHKLKVELKLSTNRLKLLQSKKTSLNNKSRREIATLLDTGKIASAYVRVEHIIREDYTIEALEILELYCELLGARLALIEQSREPDSGIEDAIASVIYASMRMDLKELGAIRELFVAKYGAEFVKAAADNVDGNVNPKLMHKLSVQAPARSLVEMYLKEIARVYKVNWRPDGDEDSDEDSPSGDVESAETADAVEPAESSASGLPNAPEKPSPPQQGDGLPSLDELQKRFEALKRR